MVKIVHQAVVLACLAASAAAQGCVESIAAVALSTPDLSALVALAMEVDLIPALSDVEAEYTVLAPTNQAFEALGPEVTAELLANKPALKDIILDHVFPGALMVDDLRDGMELTNLNGNIVTVTFAEAPSEYTFTAPNDGTTGSLVLGDVEACASYVHIIDSVLVAGLPGGDTPGAY